MAINKLILIDPSGLPIASFPETEETQMSVFSGILASLSSLSEQYGYGELEGLKIGGKKYYIKKINGNILIAVFDNKNKYASWYLDLLTNALKSVLTFVKNEEGVIKKHEYEAFRQVLKKFYEQYDSLIDKYNELVNAYLEAKNRIGDKSLTILENVFLQDSEVEEVDGHLVFKNLRISDPESLIEVFNRALFILKSYLRA